MISRELCLLGAATGGDAPAADVLGDATGVATIVLGDATG